MHRNVFLVAIIALVSSLAGCTSTSSPSGPRPAAAAGTVDAAVSKLEKGMSADAVRQLLGAPAETSMVVTANGMAEIWTYHRTFRIAQQVQTSTQTIPAYLGPGRGDQGMGTVEEPVYSVESREVNETLKLLMFQDKLLEWKRAATEKRSFY